jgi:hypothetical protein
MMLNRLVLIALLLSLSMACKGRQITPNQPSPPVATLDPTPPPPAPEPPPPAPEPPPDPPAPEPPPGPTTTDEIDLNTIAFHHQNGADANKVRGWPIQSQLAVTFDRDRREFCLIHDPSPSWPARSGIDSVGWVVVFDTPDGRPHAWTFDYYRPRSACKPWHNFDLHHDTYPVFPGWVWRAKTGLLVGFMRSRMARFASDNNGEGRSNLILVTLPFV